MNEAGKKCLCKVSDDWLLTCSRCQFPHLLSGNSIPLCLGLICDLQRCHFNVRQSVCAYLQHSGAMWRSTEPKPKSTCLKDWELLSFGWIQWISISPQLYLMLQHNVHCPCRNKAGAGLSDKHCIKLFCWVHRSAKWTLSWRRFTVLCSSKVHL